MVSRIKQESRGLQVEITTSADSAPITNRIPEAGSLAVARSILSPIISVNSDSSALSPALPDLCAYDSFYSSPTTDSTDCELNDLPSIPCHPFEEEVIVPLRRHTGYELNDPPSTLCHPFEEEVIVPLRRSWVCLEAIRNDPLNTAQIREMQDLARELNSFASQILDQAKFEHQIPEAELKYSPQSPGTGPRIPAHLLCHEMRTPLHGILGFLNLLEEDPNPNYTFAIENGLKSLEIIAENMGCEEFRLVILRLPFLLEKLLSNVKSQTEQIDPRVVINFQCDDLQLRVKGDYQKISQVLINLISNAIKYSPKPGVVTVAIRSIREDRNHAHLRFMVSDNGAGMAQDVQKRLFQKYSTGAAPTDSHLPSTGIGLYLSQEYIKAMGSQIQIDSELGSGSTFFFDLKLPVFHKQLPRNRLLAKNQAVFLKNKDLTILAADDDSVNRKINGIFLKKAGLNNFLEAYVAVENGRCAFEAFLKQPHRYDIVLLDHQMPEMDGWQTAQRINQISLLFPIILIAGIDQSEVERLSSQAKSDGLNLTILMKPVQASTLIKAINRLT